MSRPMMTMIVLLLAGLAPANAAAQSGGGNAQVLWGNQFRDASTGASTVDGRMATLTLEHSGAWELGDHFFFVDLTAGTFHEAEGRGYRMYAEWTPRLSLSKATGRQWSVGPIADVVLAGEVHAGSGGHAAALFGTGVDFTVPAFAVFSAHAFHRVENGGESAWQGGIGWSLPFRIGLEGRFEGFVDIVDGASRPRTVMAQPQLLIELGSLTRSDRRDLQVGVEWYLQSDGVDWHSVPQALVRWAW